MSQHDYSIANAGGAAVRSAINSALGAIQSSNSGSSAPSATAAGMFWLDTSADPYVLKIRDKGNNHWLTIGNVSDPGSDARMSVGTVLQIVTNSSNTPVSNGSGTGSTPVWVTVISASITPQTGNKVLIMADWPVGSAVYYAFTRIIRGSTVLNTGTQTGSQHEGVYTTQPHAGDIVNPYSVSFVDAAHGGDGATAITYPGQMSAQTGGNTVYAGRSSSTSVNAGCAGINITLMEIAA